MFDFIIIGGGTAGLSAAVYACRANKSTLVLERESFGGQIVDSPLVENYPGIKNITGAQFASDLFEQAENAGASFKCEAVLSAVRYGDVIRVKTEADEYTARAVIIAAGCEHRRLGVEREEELIGAGVSYCALCDGAFYKNGTVAVVGGGNAAFTDALYLADIAGLVYVIHRRDEYRAEPALVERAERLNTIRLVKKAVVKELVGDGELTGLTLEVDGKRESLKVDGLFVAIGQQPENEAFGTALDENGYIVTDELDRKSVV